MSSFQETLASWSTIVATLLSVLSLIQSRAWLTALALLFLSTSILAGFRARRDREVLDSAAISIDGRSIDSLNIANLRRRVNRTLVIQEAHQVAVIEGEDLKISWRYSGFCRAARESVVEFSVEADHAVPFSSLDCFAHDLRTDPSKRHKIRPVLIGTDGISRKLAVPLLQPLTAQQPFNVLLQCTLPGCMKAGVDYYISTLSFAQNLVGRSAVRLVFIGKRPEWVRVYKCVSDRATLLKDLRPVHERAGKIEYLDHSKGVEGSSAKVYLFSRSARES